MHFRQCGIHHLEYQFSLSVAYLVLGLISSIQNDFGVFVFGIRSSKNIDVLANKMYSFDKKYSFDYIKDTWKFLTF